MFSEADVDDKNSAAESKHMPRVYTWTDDHIVLMCILEGIPDDLVSDNISMVFLSSQHRTTKYGA